MRIALIPLDHRPPNYQFPQRLAAIAGVDLRLPDRERLGSLQTPADGLALAHWLRDTAPGCDALIIAWDALLYGGLVQSRQPELAPQTLAQLQPLLAEAAATGAAVYSYLTVPRLGVTVRRQSDLVTHEMVREYFIAAARADDDPRDAAKAEALRSEIGPLAVERLWQWRLRNFNLAVEALTASAQLGFRHLHVAVEDNAPSGPHLREVEALRQSWLQLARVSPGLQATFFDGADECACLLLAKAVTELRQEPALPVQLNVHPRAPGADRYTGLYETHTLADGLMILGKLLGLDYRYDPAPCQWLVAHGVQPQPDLFTGSAARVFNNPYLLPKSLETQSAVYLADLSACNGANPRLAIHLARLLPPGGLRGLVGFNTNFNTLGVSAACLRLAQSGAADPAALQRFTLERLADDVVYQSLARADILRYLKQTGQDPMDFRSANRYIVDDCLAQVQQAWQGWISGEGSPLLELLGWHGPLPPVRFSFPWSRAFEVEATVDA